MIVTPSITCPRCGWKLDDHARLGKVAGVLAYFCRARGCSIAFALVGGAPVIAYEVDHGRQREVLALEIPRALEGQAHLAKVLSELKRI